MQPPHIDGVALEAWSFYLMVQHQWHYASGGMGSPIKIGLNYPTIETIAKNRDIKLKGLLFELLQLIEHKILIKESEHAK